MSVHASGHEWDFPKIRVPYLGVLIIRILLFRVLYWGPLFSETPKYKSLQNACIIPWGYSVIFRL